MNKFKKVFVDLLAKDLATILSVTEIQSLIEIPSYETHGDLAFPCFQLAKYMKKAPHIIAEEVASTIHHPLFEAVEATGPYVNVFLNKQKVSKEILQTIVHNREDYGSHSIGKGKNIVIDFSSPNIAKPFSMGHLRSTVIGNSLANIVEKCGYRAIRINHLGDWGTQFGKLIVAYELWGDEVKVRENPIKELLDLYVRFHVEAETDPQLDEQAREQFKKLEDGDQTAAELWKWFKDESLNEFEKIYDLLGIKFDSYAGEAFYNDQIEGTIELLTNQQLLSQSKGAEVVQLLEYDLPPCLMKKSDGATLYATRDLTAALYRAKTYEFAKALYVVGQEQRLHFQQVFAVLDKLGYDWAKNMEHISFGFILKDGKKMSTRKGKVVLLEEVLQEAIQLVKKNIEAKNPNIKNKEDVAKMVGVGAVIFHDLKNERQNDVEFSLDEMLTFEGNTGPYVQYTYARGCSILKRATNFTSQQNISKGLADSYSWSVIRSLLDFPEVVERSYRANDPSVIAKYVLTLAQQFNTYYNNVKILVEDEEMEGRLALVQAVTIVLKEGLRLLGLQAPEEM